MGSIFGRIAWNPATDLKLPRPAGRDDIPTNLVRNDSDSTVFVFDPRGNGPVAIVPPRSDGPLIGYNVGYGRPEPGAYTAYVYADAQGPMASMVLQRRKMPRHPAAFRRISNADVAAAKLFAREKTKGKFALSRLVHAFRAKRAARRAAAASQIQARFRLYLVKFPVRECAICLVDHPRQSFIRMHQHDGACKFCPGCVKMTIRTAVDAGRWNIQCASHKCKAKLADADIVRCAGKEVLKQHRDNLTQGHSKWLSRVKTGDGIEPEFRTFLQENVRSCPTCKVLIYRYAGCDHMSCRCGAHFNWQQKEARLFHQDRAKT